MRKRVLVGVAAVAALVAAVCLLRPAPRFSRAHFDRLREGMTEAEVEEVLGPPGDYRAYGRATIPPPPGTGLGYPMKVSGLSYPELVKLRHQTTPDGRPRLTEKEWWGHTFFIQVAFDENGIAIGRCFGDVYPPDGLTPLQKLAKWLLR